MAYSKDQLIELVQQYAGMFGIDPGVAVAQHRRESGFRNDVVYGPFVGSAGEKGMSQFTPGTWATWGQGDHNNAYVPENSLNAWGKYMTYLLRKFNGDYERALQGYNGGEGNVDRGTVSKAARQYASAILSEAGRGESSLPVLVEDSLSQVRMEPGIMESLGGIGLLAIGLVVFLIIGGKK